MALLFSLARETALELKTTPLMTARSGHVETSSSLLIDSPPDTHHGCHVITYCTDNQQMTIRVWLLNMQHAEY